MVDVRELVIRISTTGADDALKQVENVKTSIANAGKGVMIPFAIDTSRSTESIKQVNDEINRILNSNKNTFALDLSANTNMNKVIEEANAAIESTQKYIDLAQTNVKTSISVDNSGIKQAQTDLDDLIGTASDTIEASVAVGTSGDGGASGPTSGNGSGEFTADQINSAISGANIGQINTATTATNNLSSASSNLSRVWNNIRTSASNFSSGISNAINSISQAQVAIGAAIALSANSAFNSVRTSDALAEQFKGVEKEAVDKFMASTPEYVSWDERATIMASQKMKGKGIQETMALLEATEKHQFANAASLKGQSVESIMDTIQRASKMGGKGGTVASIEKELKNVTLRGPKGMLQGISVDVKALNKDALKEAEKRLRNEGRNVDEKTGKKLTGSAMGEAILKEAIRYQLANTKIDMSSMSATQRIQLMKTKVDNLKNAIGGEAVPVLLTFVNTISSLVSVISKIPGATTLIAYLGVFAALAAIGTKVVPAFMGIVVTMKATAAQVINTTKNFGLLSKAARGNVAAMEALAAMEAYEASTATVASTAKAVASAEESLSNAQLIASEASLAVARAEAAVAAAPIEAEMNLKVAASEKALAIARLESNAAMSTRTGAAATVATKTAAANGTTIGAAGVGMAGLTAKITGPINTAFAKVLGVASKGVALLSKAFLFLISPITKAFTVLTAYLAGIGAVAAAVIAVIAVIAGLVVYLTYKWGFFTKAWEAFAKSEIGADVIETFKQIRFWIRILIDDIDAMWENMKAGAGGELFTAISMVAEFIGGVFSDINELYKGYKSGGITGMFKSISGPITAVLAIVVTFLTLIYRVLKVVLTGVWMGITLIVKILGWLWSTVISIGKWIKDGLGMTKEEKKLKMLKEADKSNSRWVDYGSVDESDPSWYTGSGWYNKEDNKKLTKDESAKLDKLKKEYDNAPKGFLDGIEDAVKKGVAGIGEQIVNALKPITKPIKDLVDALSNFLTNNFGIPKGGQTSDGSKLDENEYGSVSANTEVPGTVNVIDKNGNRYDNLQPDHPMIKQMGLDVSGMAPAAAEGGLIKSRGLISVHPGEPIIPAKISSSSTLIEKLSAIANSKSTTSESKVSGDGIVNYNTFNFNARGSSGIDSKTKQEFIRMIDDYMSKQIRHRVAH
jgi:hypothetical protein